MGGTSSKPVENLEERVRIQEQKIDEINADTGSRLTRCGLKQYIANMMVTSDMENVNTPEGLERAVNIVLDNLKRFPALCTKCIPGELDEQTKRDQRLLLEKTMEKAKNDGKRAILKYQCHDKQEGEGSFLTQNASPQKQNCKEQILVELNPPSGNEGWAASLQKESDVNLFDDLHVLEQNKLIEQIRHLPKKNKTLILRSLPQPVDCALFRGKDDIHKLLTNILNAGYVTREDDIRYKK